MEKLEHIKLKNLPVPEGMDEECIDLYQVLNSLKGVKTNESCCGHCKNRYMFFFTCDDFATLGLLGRVTDRNYSDGKWVVSAVNSDYCPKYHFALMSKEVFKTQEEMDESVNRLIHSFDHWLNPYFDEHFQR